MPHQVNVVSAARSNEDFRRVLFTGERSQLVVMTIPPGGEVGDERHDHVEQTLFCLSGNGTAILDGARSPFAPGDAVVVTPGTRHNFLNTGTEPLRIYTIYAPAEPHRRTGPPHQSRRGRRPRGRGVRARRRRVSGVAKMPPMHAGASINETRAPVAGGLRALAHGHAGEPDGHRGGAAVRSAAHARNGRRARPQQAGPTPALPSARGRDAASVWQTELAR